ncbi:MAG: energy transducer TonB [Opitutae bacterium]|nr:energy transducer TonB [Opitutae bacterium]
MNKALSTLSVLALFVGSFLAALAEGKREQAVPVRTVSPEMPASFRREGSSGLVTVSFEIDEQGNVKEPKVEKSTHRELEEPTLKALKKWKFKPATQDGTPVPCRITLPIKFSVE